MKKIKKWLKITALENFGILVVALVLWLFLPSFFNSISLLLLGFFIGINWQAIKDLSDIDEKIEEKINSLRGTVDGTKQGGGKT